MACRVIVIHKDSRMFLVSSILHECIRSCNRTQLASGSANLFSAHVQLASDKTNLFRLRATREWPARATLKWHVCKCIFSHVTREWHEKFVQKLTCHTRVNVKFKLSCTVFLLHEASVICSMLHSFLPSSLLSLTKLVRYKQKIWLEKYLAKSIMNHFDEIKFGGSRVTMYNKIPLNL